MKKDAQIIIYSKGICHCSVCAENNLPVDKIEEFVNKENPTGIGHGWKLSAKNFKTGESNPCDCNEYPDERKHYLFNC